MNNNFPIWNLGGGIKHRDNLIGAFRDHKQYLDTNHKLFNYVYDSIFGLKWNGGRVCMPENTLVISDLIEVIQIYNKLGVGFNWSFSNVLLTEEHMKDDYCNLLLEATHSPMNGVILTSKILRDHVRKNFPRFRIIYSVCNGLKELDAYKKALDENDIVVLHPDFNHDYKFLEALPDKDRIELMVNDICVYGCPFRYQHYKELSEYSLNQSVNPIIHFPQELDLSRGKSCMAVDNGYERDERNRLSAFDIDHMLDMGFKHFKLIGREHDWEHYWEVDLQPNLHKYFLRRLIKNNNLNLHI